MTAFETTGIHLARQVGVAAIDFFNWPVSAMTIEQRWPEETGSSLVDEPVQALRNILGPVDQRLDHIWGEPANTLLYGGLQREKDPDCLIPEIPVENRHGAHPAIQALGWADACLIGAMAFVYYSLQTTNYQRQQVLTLALNTGMPVDQRFHKLLVHHFAYHEEACVAMVMNERDCLEARVRAGGLLVGHFASLFPIFKHPRQIRDTMIQKAREYLDGCVERHAISDEQAFNASLKILYHLCPDETYVRHVLTALASFEAVPPWVKMEIIKALEAEMVDDTHPQLDSLDHIRMAVVLDRRSTLKQRLQYLDTMKEPVARALALDVLATQVVRAEVPRDVTAEHKEIGSRLLAVRGITAVDDYWFDFFNVEGLSFEGRLFAAEQIRDIQKAREAWRLLATSASTGQELKNLYEKASFLIDCGEKPLAAALCAALARNDLSYPRILGELFERIGSYDSAVEVYHRILRHYSLKLGRDSFWNLVLGCAEVCHRIPLVSFHPKDLEFVLTRLRVFDDPVARHWIETMAGVKDPEVGPVAERFLKMSLAGPARQLRILERDMDRALEDAKIFMSSDQTTTDMDGRINTALYLLARRVKLEEPIRAAIREAFMWLVRCWVEDPVQVNETVFHRVLDWMMALHDGEVDAFVLNSLQVIEKKPETSDAIRILCYRKRTGLVKTREYEARVRALRAPLAEAEA